MTSKAPKMPPVPPSSATSRGARADRDEPPAVHDSEQTRVCSVDSERIYVKRNWFLRVNPEGYVEGNYCEGAFGCVIPLNWAGDERGDGRQRLALKIPRLLADSVRENEFIRQIVETEARLVAKANHDVCHVSGLVPTQEIDSDILRGVRELRGCDDELRRGQDGCILLFLFHKNRPPRVVAAKYDEDGRFTVFPRRAEADLAFLTREIWEEMRDPNQEQVIETLQRCFREPYYFELIAPTQQVEGGMRRGPTSWTMSTERDPAVWYCALPSIVYKWASGTLQEAVSLRAHRDWRLVEHYDLHIRILRGVKTLHSKGLIHGDLRPANIMTMGDPSAPEEYAVGDYGSFSVERARNGPAPAASGHTMTGAGVSRHRTSMFYAPERRIGRECETGDVAVVLDQDPDSPFYLIALGWKSQILKEDGGGLRPELLASLGLDWEELWHSVDEPTRAGHEPELLRNGDRLRLREYVFEVRASKSTPHMLLLLCDRRYAQILHERVAVYSHDHQKLPNDLVITLPMYTEIHQWSAATDLYGVGTLALYTLFMSAVQRPIRDEDAADKTLTARFESMVAGLIQRLGSVPDIIEIWYDLDLFWMHAETWTASVPDPGAQVVPGSEMTLSEFANKTTNNLLRIKNMKFILHCFSEEMVTPRDGQAHPTAAADEEAYNLAHFLFFIHFIISCIHRRRTLEAMEDRRRSIDYSRILCADRCERPQQGDGGSAAEAAFQRLVILQQRLNSPIYREFVVGQSKLDFDYMAESEFQLQRQRNDLMVQLGELREAATKIAQQRQATYRLVTETRKLIDELSLRRLPGLHVRKFLRRARELLGGSRATPHTPPHELPCASTVSDTAPTVTTAMPAPPS